MFPWCVCGWDAREQIKSKTFPCWANLRRSKHQSSSGEEQKRLASRNDEDTHQWPCIAGTIRANSWLILVCCLGSGPKPFWAVAAPVPMDMSRCFPPSQTRHGQIRRLELWCALKSTFFCGKCREPGEHVCPATMTRLCAAVSGMVCGPLAYLQHGWNKQHDLVEGRLSCALSLKL